MSNLLDILQETADPDPTKLAKSALPWIRHPQS